MSLCIGIRKEDKNRWERRVPLVPAQIKELKDNYNMDFVVQSSEIRAYPDKEYLEAGAVVQEDLSSCKVIFGVKEMPMEFFQPEKIYVFFSHTIKGQPHNMPMLKRLLELKCTLIDYEKIVDEHGYRLLFFGRFAGIAGMLDTLHIFGQRLHWEGVSTPFTELEPAYSYESLEAVQKKVAEVGRKIKHEGLPQNIIPLVIGLAGYGNVSKGAQELLDLLPMQSIMPEELSQVYQLASSHHIYKVVFREDHMVEPITGGFELQDYYQHPENYRPIFEQYLPHLSILMNCIYWDAHYPKLVTKKGLHKLFIRGKRCLRIIGDISCDIGGAIEFTVKCTEPDNPCYVYNPLEDTITDGYTGEGVIVLAVDNLPGELPREASASFGAVLKRFIPEIVNADFSVDFKHCPLSQPLKNAVIAYHGELTPNYRYLYKYL